MGIYLNPGNEGFRTTRNSKYVDKSGLIAIVNHTINTPEKMSCVCRARRFGKSTAAQMLCAYYDQSCDSSGLFDDLEIANDPAYREHLNQYNVIYIDITSIIGEVSGIDGVIPFIREQVKREVRREYKEIDVDESFAGTLVRAVELSGKKFIAIIDEWDAIIRDRRTNPDIQYTYLEFLRSLFKSSGTTDKIFAAAYMTGILPIKKDGSQSAISEFREYTMLHPRGFEEYFGFTGEDVKALCEEYGLDFSMMKRWYDGYSFERIESVYNPNSVMYAVQNKAFRSYWQMSSSATGLLDLVNLNYDGLSDAVVDLLQGKNIRVEVEDFQNDTTSFASRDDVLTLLIHYGYLSYNAESAMARIPNEEIKREFARIVHRIKIQTH